MRPVRLGVDAETVAARERRRARAGARHARGPRRADEAAATAVLRIARDVDARAAASHGGGRARGRALAARAEASRRARVGAGAAVRRIRREVRARAAARSLARVTRTASAHAREAGRAGATARAAVARVAREIHARARAGREARAARGRAAAAEADLAARTRDPAAAAVLRIGARVDASEPAELLARRAHARAADARLGCEAGRVACAAALHVRREIDARAAAVGETRAARRRASAEVADGRSAAADDAAAAAVARIRSEIDARTAAVVLAGRARALPERARLRRTARGRARAAVIAIARQIGTRAGAVGAAHAARGRARPEIAERAIGAAHDSAASAARRILAEVGAAARAELLADLRTRRDRSIAGAAAVGGARVAREVERSASAGRRRKRDRGADHGEHLAASCRRKSIMACRLRHPKARHLFRECAAIRQAPRICVGGRAPVRDSSVVSVRRRWITFVALASIALRSHPGRSHASVRPVPFVVVRTVCALG